MPNTEPVIDDVALVDFIMRRARDTARDQRASHGGDDQGPERARRWPRSVCLRDAGAIAFTNGKTSLADAKMMRNVLAYARISARSSSITWKSRRSPRTA